MTELRHGRPGFDSWQGYVLFIFATASRPVLGPTQPPIGSVLGALYLGSKLAGV